MSSKVSRTVRVGGKLPLTGNAEGVSYLSIQTTTGGRALKFYSSVRLDVRKIDTIKQGDKILGSRTRVKVVKNKVAPPFKQAEFDIMYGEGISKIGDLLDIAANVDIVKKSGSWYNYQDIKLGQGRENVKKFLADNMDLTNEIEEKVRKYYKLGSEYRDLEEDEFDENMQDSTDVKGE